MTTGLQIVFHAVSIGFALAALALAVIVLRGIRRARSVPTPEEIQRLARTLGLPTRAAPPVVFVEMMVGPDDDETPEVQPPSPTNGCRCPACLKRRSELT